jgi:hypothetical protein
MGDLCSHCGSPAHEADDCDARRPLGVQRAIELNKHADLRGIIELLVDLAYYRSVTDDGGLGVAAWIELQHAVSRLPERPS